MGNSQNVAGQFPSFCTSTCSLVKSMSFPPGCATKHGVAQILKQEITTTPKSSIVPLKITNKIRKSKKLEYFWGSPLFPKTPFVGASGPTPHTRATWGKARNASSSAWCQRPPRTWVIYTYNQYQQHISVYLQTRYYAIIWYIYDMLICLRA